MEIKRLPMRSHHVHVSPKKVVCPLDSQLPQRITVHELLSQATLIADQIVEMRPQPGNHVTHCGRAISGLSKSFDEVEHRTVPESLIQDVVHLIQ
jgi:hypothetical protein